MDQWQLEEFAKVLAKLQGEGGDARPRAETLRQCHVEPAERSSRRARCLAEYGPAAKLAVIPKGPYVLPYVVGV